MSYLKQAAAKVIFLTGLMLGSEFAVAATSECNRKSTDAALTQLATKLYTSSLKDAQEGGKQTLLTLTTNDLGIIREKYNELQKADLALVRSAVRDNDAAAKAAVKAPELKAALAANVSLSDVKTLSRTKEDGVVAVIREAGVAVLSKNADHLRQTGKPCQP